MTREPIETSRMLPRVAARAGGRRGERARRFRALFFGSVLGPLAGSLLAATIASAGTADSHPAPAGGAFGRSALLARFDADGNGELDRNERARVREAFGGIDVPLLPEPPHRYGLPDRARSLYGSELEAADSTPGDNPLSDRGAALGRVLFYDRMLSRNGTVACASCHIQEAGFSDPRRFSIGFQGGATARNSMGLANLRYTKFRGESPGFFWDERAPSLEAQALMPIQDEVEMGMELPDLEEKLRELPYYPPLFEAAFGSPEVSSERIARALAQFLRAMVSFDAKFDRAFAGAGGMPGDYSVAFPGFTEEENRGKSLFIDGLSGVAERGCAFCHVPPTLGMPKAFNNGLALEYKDRGLGALDRPPNDPFTPSNDGKFKAPSLRNVELTAPYMHDGRFATLEEVVEHYSSGVHPHKNLGLVFDDDASDGETSGFGYSPEEKAALVAFLKTLTDRSLVSDPRFSDPFIRATEP